MTGPGSPVSHPGGICDTHGTAMMSADPAPDPAREGSPPEAARVLAIAATFQERDNILRLAAAVLAADPRLDLLVIDDDSPDGTGDLVAEQAAVEPRLTVLVRRGRRGLGSAVMDGLREARSRGYQLAVNLDADFSHDPADIPRLLAAVEPPGEPPADVVVGSRKIHGGDVVGWPLSRHILSRLVCWWTRWIMRVPARDGSSGFRVIRLDVLDMIESPTDSYAFHEQTLWQVHRAGGLIREVPIIFTGRRQGTSKPNLRQMMKGGCDLLRFGLATWCNSGERR